LLSRKLRPWPLAFSLPSRESIFSVNTQTRKCVHITICVWFSCYLYFHPPIIPLSTMDSLRYRFGTPALPRFPIISPSAFPESWAQPTTGNLFTFNSSATSLPPAKHWWDKPWVPAVVVALFVYSVMASVVLAWFLFMRSLEQRRPVCVKSIRW
jgi:hypothetical protein